MNKHGNISKRLIAFICVILMLTYASVGFLSHSHDCAGADCAVCAFIESSRGVLMGMILSAVTYQLADLTLVLVNEYAHIPVWREHTPVGLKVKLSD